MTDTTHDDLVKQSLLELLDIVRCRCHPAYTGRGMHDPDCECDSADAVKVVADRIEELEAKLGQHNLVEAAVQGALKISIEAARENAERIAKLIREDRESTLDRRQIADELWHQFKDRWRGEKKFALREMVKFLQDEEDRAERKVSIE